MVSDLSALDPLLPLPLGAKGPVVLKSTSVVFSTKLKMTTILHCSLSKTSRQLSFSWSVFCKQVFTQQGDGTLYSELSYCCRRQQKYSINEYNSPGVCLSLPQWQGDRKELHGLLVMHFDWSGSQERK